MPSTPAALNNSQTLTLSKEKAKSDSILPALLAGSLGLMLLYAAGFAEVPQLHNAAHDGRHSASFPCH
jgi:cobalt transporter subunit CbtB